MSLIFLEPLFKERIWGGTRLKTDYGFHIPNNHTGECWAISAHPHGDTLVREGEYKGLPLSKLWEQHPELFANTVTRQFPLMIKIIDAHDDLSVQVHPDDKLAQLVEDDQGKAECWYIIDAKKDAKIIYGHSAKTKEEFKHKANQQEWNSLLTTTPVKRGDHFDVPAGTVHAIGAGVLILEVQQSSDVTYRIYDFDRKDSSGQLRELHLDKAFAAVTAPHKKTDANQNQQRKLGESAIFTPIASNEHFSSCKLDISGRLDLKISAQYLLVSVINGSGVINDCNVKKGDSFIVPNSIRNLIVDGFVSLIVANEAPK